MVKSYSMIFVEGPHDQAAVSRILMELGLENFRGNRSQLDVFWSKVIPHPPKDDGELYPRNQIPSFLESNDLSVAIVDGKGSELPKAFNAVINNYASEKKKFRSIGIVIDADNRDVMKLSDEFLKLLKKYFSNWPKAPSLVSAGNPRLGLYILPDNKTPGVLDTVLLKCAERVYPDHLNAATNYIQTLRKNHANHWSGFDHDKALVASITSILRPGQSNTASLKQDGWICSETCASVKEVTAFKQFLSNLIL